MTSTASTLPTYSRSVADMTRAYVEIRSQHAKRGWSGFTGPDTYVAVQVVPPGEAPLVTLRQDVAAARGITIRHFGEGYYRSRGPHSALGRAIAAAEAFAAAVNARPPKQRIGWSASSRLDGALAPLLPTPETLTPVQTARRAMKLT